MRCIELNGCVCVFVLPETGGVGSAGCSTDNCLNTAYLSEEEEDEDPDTGVSMAGTLHEADKTYSSQSKQIKELYMLQRVSVLNESISFFQRKQSYWPHWQNSYFQCVVQICNLKFSSGFF